MRISSLFVAVASLAGALSFAPIASAAEIHEGTKLVDASGAKIAFVDRVNADGSVSVIYEGRYLTIPANTLTAQDNVVKTSLTKADVRKLGSRK